MGESASIPSPITGKINTNRTVQDYTDGVRGFHILVRDYNGRRYRGRDLIGTYKKKKGASWTLEAARKIYFSALEQIMIEQRRPF